MSERHALPSEGCWVELRDYKELRYGDKLHVQEQVTNPDNRMLAGSEILKALYGLLITNWQLPETLPLPSQDPKVILMLTMEDGNALESLIQPARERLFPGDPEPATAEEHAKAVADPASPTVPSVDS